MIRPRSTPFVSVACAILVVYFLAKGLILDGGAATFSLALGALVALVGLWLLWSARFCSVTIDEHTVTVNRRRGSQRHPLADIVQVNLASLDRQVEFADGSAVRLPLEGRELVEAGALLSARRQASGGMAGPSSTGRDGSLIHSDQEPG